jgi:Phage integrase, N-terminal SAM-like domain
MNVAIPAIRRQTCTPGPCSDDEMIRPAPFTARRAALPRTPIAIEAREPRPAEPPPSILLGVYLEDWLRDVVRLSVRPKTFVSYRSVVRLHVVPCLGHHPLVDLRPADVQAFLNAKAASGLAPRTVAYLRNVLRQALGHAERTELVGRNVARLALPPRVPRREVHPSGPTGCGSSAWDRPPSMSGLLVGRCAGGGSARVNGAQGDYAGTSQVSGAVPASRWSSTIS